MKVFSWMVNELDKAQKLVELDIDGIITDYPDRINKKSVLPTKGE